MELEYRKLSESEAAATLGGLDGWTIENGKLAKAVAFDSYLDGVAFASAVAYLAEKLDHHPDIEIGWRRVRIAMNTHAVEGLSPYDFELAKRIEALG
jgi:4a-hydroxytetrahydrobiopterin dehydratase